jgi:hypothetical protein
MTVEAWVIVGCTVLIIWTLGDALRRIEKKLDTIADELEFLNRDKRQAQMSAERMARGLPY